MIGFLLYNILNLLFYILIKYDISFNKPVKKLKFKKLSKKIKKLIILQI